MVFPGLSCFKCMLPRKKSRTQKKVIEKSETVNKGNEMVIDQKNETVNKGNKNIVTDEDERRWEAEPDNGVHMILEALPNGGNQLKKIRFSMEHFNRMEAKRWWNNNYENLIELYSLSRENLFCNELQQPPEDVHKLSISGVEVKKSVGSITEEEEDIGIMSVRVEDEPGVTVTVNCMSNGAQELVRVELCKEMFAEEEEGRLWWEKNKGRLNRKYTVVVNS